MEKLSTDLDWAKSRPGIALLRCQRAVLAPANRRDRFQLFAIFLLLTFARLPHVVLQGGRLLCEEGSVFFAHAATTASWHAVFYSYAGYMNLWANLASFAAWHLVVLEYAPLITLIFAAAIQICPAVLLITSRAGWLSSRLILGAVLLLLVAAPSGEEVWLNTLHSQFFLALCAGLILALETENGARETFRLVLLSLAPLFGLVAIVLLPMFILRSFLERSRARLRQSLLLGLSSAIQIVFFYQPHGRSLVFEPQVNLATFYIKNLLVPALTLQGAAVPAASLRAALDHGILPGYVIGVLVFTLISLALLFCRGPKTSVWLILGAVGMAVFCYYGTIEPGTAAVMPTGQERYSFVSQIMIAWAFAALAASIEGIRSKIAGAVLIWLCLTSSLDYMQPSSNFDNGPAWHQEVAKWRANPLYSPMVWPGAAWRVPSDALK